MVCFYFYLACLEFSDFPSSVLQECSCQYKRYPSVFSQGILKWTILELLRQVNSRRMISIGVIESYIVVAPISVLCRFHLALSPFTEFFL